MQFVEAWQCTVWFWETLATCYLCNNVCVEQHQASYFVIILHCQLAYQFFFSSFTFLKSVPILQRRRIVLLILHHPSFITCIYLLSTQLVLGKAVQRYNAGILHLPLFMNIFCLAKSRKLSFTSDSKRQRLYIFSAFTCKYRTYFIILLFGTFFHIYLHIQFLSSSLFFFFG